MNCPDCNARLDLEPHLAACTEPLRVRTSDADPAELRRALISLERCNAGAAEWLLVRGIHPHTYRPGSEPARNAA